jgi:nucleotide-binding universal stress UspA family protein
MKDNADQNSDRPADGLRRILVACDLTAYTDRAIDRAVILAEQSRAAIRLVHAIDPGVLPEKYLKKIIREAEAYLAHELRDSGIDTNIDVSVRVLRGNAKMVVTEEAQAMQADIIIMGLSHDTSLGGIVRGTTIDKIVRSSQCPVLVVKTRARRPYMRITAAIDLAEPSRQALNFALRKFPRAGICVIHVAETGPVGPTSDALSPSVSAERRHQIEDMVTARFSAAGRGGSGESDGPSLHFASGRAVNVLSEEIPRMNPDLVVMGTHGRTGVSNLFLGSVAETLLEVLRHDVLVVRA